MKTMCIYIYTYELTKTRVFHITLLSGCVPPPHLPVQIQQSGPELPGAVLCAAICDLLCLAQHSEDSQNHCPGLLGSARQGLPQAISYISGRTWQSSPSNYTLFCFSRSTLVKFLKPLEGKNPRFSLYRFIF